ncbi:MAG: hypothetical protein KDE27_32465 [Planctomycetes bacterium]|nr:hypothetical protein [Planctomycetota bacterium]
MRRSSIWLPLAAIAAAAAAWPLWNGVRGSAETTAPPAVSAPAVIPPTAGPSPTAPAESAHGVVASTAPIDRTRSLELPDGTFVPALNGASGELSLSASWGDRPWSRILDTERSDAGIDWYVHADGTRTTTEMRWRPDLGREDALVRIAVPVAGAPPLGADGPPK